MPIDSRAARLVPARHPLSTAVLSRTTALLVLACLAAGARPLGAQTAPAMRSTDAWSLDGQYLQLAPGALRRDATPSLGFTLGHTLRGGRSAWRAEGGWSRAVRRGTTAQGVTLGVSAGLRAHERSRLTLRPGLALLAGWAESQDSTVLYDWRGVAGSPAAGTSGTQYSWSTVRGRTTGIGASVGAELRLTGALALSASVRQWRFGGAAAAANRNATLAGVGVVAQPRALVRDARRWWRGSRRPAPHAAHERGHDEADAESAPRPEDGR